MADLVIKPTSGNLVFKDDQNVARATIATSSGATTLSGNVTMSGTANNLGTVTAGSIAGGAITSATTFPVGHVVSFDSAKYNGSDIGMSTNAFTECNSALRVAITPTSPNKVVLWCMGGIPHGGSLGHTMRSSWGIVGGSLNLADSDQGLETHTDNYKNGGHSILFVDTPSSYGSEIIYTPTYCASNANQVYFTEGNVNQNIWAIAMEIKQ